MYNLKKFNFYSAKVFININDRNAFVQISFSVSLVQILQLIFDPLQSNQFSSIYVQKFIASDNVIFVYFQGFPSSGFRPSDINSILLLCLEITYCVTNRFCTKFILHRNANIHIFPSLNSSGADHDQKYSFKFSI